VLLTGTNQLASALDFGATNGKDYVTGQTTLDGGLS
jgi:hypothetical protein